jgi:hypothetical protein
VKDLALIALFVALVAAEISVLVGAFRLARAERDARAVVLFASFAIVNDTAIEALHRFLFTDPDHPLRVAVALYGWPARAAYHVETALVLGWPLLLAGCAWRTFAGLRSRRVTDALAGAWLGGAIGLAAIWPLPIGQTAPTLHAFHLGAALVAMAAIPAGWGREWQGAHAVFVVLVPVELAVAAVGPFVRDPYANWHLARLAQLVGFTAAALLQRRRLRRLALESGGPWTQP